MPSKDSVLVEELFPGVYRIPDPKNPSKRVIATRNFTPGRSFYGEAVSRLKTESGSAEFRVWDPYRSKLAAAIINHLEIFPFRPDLYCLYLGASTGTTVSHISDIVGANGRIFAVEMAPRVAREFLENVVKYRTNIVPIIADARHPEKYPSIYGEISTIYCDIAQPDQTEIAVSNCQRIFSKNSPGILFLVVKASSIDALKPKSEVFSQQRKILENSDLVILEQIDLEPFDRQHAMIVARANLS